MDAYLKEIEAAFQKLTDRLREEFRLIRSSRPSVDLVSQLKVVYFDDVLTVQQLGSLSVVPPRELRISVWDKNAVGPVTSAIAETSAGFSLSNDGNTIRAVLPSLSSERREELVKLIRKTAEGTRIEIRSKRDEAMKRTKSAEEKKEVREDQAFAAKEKVQGFVNAANARVEALVEEKIKELLEE